MQILAAINNLSWSCQHTWQRASVNTLWCLLGCSIGDMGTILFFQLTGIPWSTVAIMTLAIVNGLMTSIILETFILSRQMVLRHAFKTACGMSLISMISNGDSDERSGCDAYRRCQTHLVGGTGDASGRLPGSFTI